MTPLPQLLATNLTLLCVLAGCHDDHDHDSHEDPVTESIEHSCKHYEEGPAKVITLGEAGKQAPDLTFEHHRLDVTFVAHADGDKGGVGTWKITKKGDYIVMLSDDVPVALLDKDGAAVKATKSLQKPIAGCAAAAVAHVHALTVGSWTLSIGPTKATGAKILLVEVETEHKDH